MMEKRRNKDPVVAISFGAKRKPPDYIDDRDRHQS